VTVLSTGSSEAALTSPRRVGPASVRTDQDRRRVVSGSVTIAEGLAVRVTFTGDNGSRPAAASAAARLLSTSASLVAGTPIAASRARSLAAGVTWRRPQMS
jgi:hypothetical protein